VIVKVHHVEIVKTKEIVPQEGMVVITGREEVDSEVETVAVDLKVVVH